MENDERQKQKAKYNERPFRPAPIRRQDIVQTTFTFEGEVRPAKNKKRKESK